MSQENILQIKYRGEILSKTVLAQGHGVFIGGKQVWPTADSSPAPEVRHPGANPAMVKLEEEAFDSLKVGDSIYAYYRAKIDRALFRSGVSLRRDTIQEVRLDASVPMHLIVTRGARVFVGAVADADMPVCLIRIH